jgi:hypothetical protein
MGSSDPLPAQATGNGYLMCITNHDELHPRRSTGPGPVPSYPLLTPRRPPKRTLRALQHLNADVAPVSALDRCRRNDDGPRASPRNAIADETATAPTGGVRFPGRGSPSACAVPQWRTPRPPAPTWWCAGVVLATIS